MSIHAISWVLKHSDARLGNRLVMIVLADHAKDDGTFAWPSVATIAEEARMSSRAVQYALRELVKKGLILERGKSQAGTRIYDVLMERGAKAAGVQNRTSNKQDSAPEPSVNRQVSSPSGEDVGLSEQIDEVFEHWRGVFGLNGNAKLTPARRKKIAARLKEKYTVARINRATDGCAASEFHRSRGHIDLTLICRSGDKLEWFEAKPLNEASAHQDEVKSALARGHELSDEDAQRQLEKIGLTA